MGAQNGADRSSLVIRNGSDQFVAAANQALATNITIGSVVNASGHSIITRTGAGAIAAYKNGASIGTDTDASSAPINLAFGVCGRNNGGSFGAAGGQFSAATIGAGLNGTEATALYNRIATYRTAVGL